VAALAGGADEKAMLAAKLASPRRREVTFCTFPTLSGEAICPR
jgi:hypothetical protein